MSRNQRAAGWVAVLCLWVGAKTVAQEIRLDQPSASKKPHLVMLTDGVDVKPGSEQVVELRFRVDPGYHINSHMPMDDLLIHDEKAEEPTLAYLLSRFAHDASKDAVNPFPEPVGVLRNVRKPTYEELLDTRITFATINVTISEEFKAQIKMVPDSMGSRFRNAAIDGYQSAVSGLIAFLLFLISAGPSLLLWTTIVFFPIWLVWKRWRRKRTKAA